jgi:cytochrome P450
MSKTMSYGILYLIHHPEIQDKIQEELDRVTLQSIFTFLGGIFTATPFLNKLPKLSLMLKWP